MKRFPFLRWWILWLVVFGAGCAGASPGQEAHPPSPPTATAEAIRPVEPVAGATPASERIRELEEAIQRGDWKKAQAVYETAGRPPLSADLLNWAMAQGIYLAWNAREAGNHREADQQIEGVRNLVRNAVSPQRIPDGFQEEFYFYLVLADSDAIDSWGEREKAIAGDPIADEVVERMARRDHLAREDIVGSPVAVCPMADRMFLIVGFHIFDLQGSFRGNAPGLDQLREGERIPRIYDVFCDGRKIQWVNVSGGGRGVSLEAEWDGQGFRLADLSRIDLAAQTHIEVRKHVEAGELEKALEAYDKGFTHQVDEDPELATLALRQGLTVARQRAEAGDIAGARRALRAALSIANVPYRLDWGTFLPEGWEQRPRSLQDWAREAYGADPQVYRDALTEYAALLIQDRLPQEAEPILRGLTVLAPDHAPVYLYLGDALWNQGKSEEARRFYRRYQELAPNGPWPDRVRERSP
ncbi:tetratricopeptide repeat protein [Thermoflexus sp.]|uniref:tetratricopeptide repeat protein n=1 Tax=Thermoflexus sp. TaxID=1969742 RepID=UPI0025F2EA31|nr:tetratricopeptide repeat protein [Thermoflexus sp.]MCS6964837.1 tetratricopeptide repeat protein [Thermoflexus sp.]MCS7351084.1 tetratricopeptide repeat protein [Thermoflexus sp.]MCX7690498.1 tetratricopeptide repeat protein [Thermoflexus sp.]MDW8180537.1 tetratricopeptide repeat protein [Anaerolineae bacterium]